MKVKFFGVLLVIVAAIAVPAARRQTAAPAAVTGELKQWHKVTLTFDGPNASETGTPNPFMDYRMTVTFTHESGAPSYAVPGYFAADGDAANTSATAGNKWRVHFSPDKTGRWNWKLSFVSGQNVAVTPAVAGTPVTPIDGAAGSVTIAATDKVAPDFRARGRLQYVGRRYLRFAGTGEYFLKVGSDAPETLLAYEDFDNTTTRKTAIHTYAPHVQDWKTGDPTWKGGKGKALNGAVNYLSSKGASSMSFLPYNAGGDGDNVWPMVDRDDKFHYDVSKLDQWQIVFDHAQSKGLYLHFKLAETENDDGVFGQGGPPRGGGPGGAGVTAGGGAGAAAGGGVAAGGAAAGGVAPPQAGAATAAAGRAGAPGGAPGEGGGGRGRAAGPPVPCPIPVALDCGDTGPERRLYLRELVARFGYELALNWNLGEENTQTTAQQRAMTQYIHDIDPYHHLTVVHTFPNWQEQVYTPLLGQTYITGASLQNEWNQTHQWTLRWVRASEGARVPWVVANDEQGNAGLGVPPDLGYQGFAGKNAQGAPIQTQHDIRKLTLWGNLMAGGAGVEYYFGYSLADNDLTLENFRSRDKTWDYGRIAQAFFRDQKIPFWDMWNADALVGNSTSDNSRYCFAKSGEIYLVYLPSGGSSDLDLRDVTGAFTVNWFDPRNGGALKRGSVATLTAGKVVGLGTPPDNPTEDWLVVVRR